MYAFYSNIKLLINVDILQYISLYVRFGDDPSLKTAYLHKNVMTKIHVVVKTKKKIAYKYITTKYIVHNSSNRYQLYKIDTSYMYLIQLISTTTLKYAK